MNKLKHIEVKEKPIGWFWACYVYRRCAETEYSDDQSGLYRINCVEPKKDKHSVLREARSIAQANNVKLINFPDLNAGIPFVEVCGELESPKENGND